MAAPGHQAVRPGRARAWLWQWLRSSGAQDLLCSPSQDGRVSLFALR